MDLPHDVQVGLFAAETFYLVDVGAVDVEDREGAIGGKQGAHLSHHVREGGDRHGTRILHPGALARLDAGIFRVGLSDVVSGDLLFRERGLGLPYCRHAGSSGRNLPHMLLIGNLS